MENSSVRVAASIDSGSTAWMLASSAMVLLMVPGLALFYGGMVRRKNVLTTMMMSFVAMAVIGVHGMLSGTASADFGGKRNAGVAVGLVDACVYFGTMSQSFLLGRILPEKGTPEAADVASWGVWPLAMAPVALVGLLLAATVWNAKPKGS